MPEHRIRLNRAWEIRAAPLETTADDIAIALLAELPSDERHDLPLIVDGMPVDDDGRPVRLLLTRWFNGPSNLQSGQSVRVVLSPACLLGRVRLNNCDLLPVEPASDQSIAGETPVPLDVTGKLQSHNRLDILVGDPMSLSAASIVLVIDEQQSDREPE